MHSLFKSDRLSTPLFVPVIMHRSRPQWHWDHGYSFSAFSPTPNPGKWKGGRNEEWLFVSKYKLFNLFAQPFSFSCSFIFWFQSTFPSVVVPPIIHASALHKPLTSCEWREQWWEHPPRRPPPSAMWVCQSRSEYPPSHLAPWSSWSHALGGSPLSRWLLFWWYQELGSQELWWRVDRQSRTVQPLCPS